MTLSTFQLRRRPQAPVLLVAASILAGLIAIMPIAGALFSGLQGGGGGARTAFASAPAGLYAVGVRSEPALDIVQAVSPSNEVLEIARIPHLAGYGSQGAVAPGGGRLALIVADGGTLARPLASLQIVELDTGRVSRLNDGLDQLQTPVWTADGSAVIVRRLSSFDTPSTSVTFLLAGLDGETRELGVVEGVSGAYALGLDAQGSFLALAIDARGSTLLRDNSEIANISPGITRDWQLSADAKQLAFIEVDVSGGLRYIPRLIDLDGNEKGSISAQAFDSSQALGVAWRPGSAAPEFGREPGSGAQPLSGGVRAQGFSAGFDVPLDYAPDGTVLAVQHWSGRSFDDAGKMELQVVGVNGRQTLETLTRFFGWARR